MECPKLYDVQLNNATKNNGRYFSLLFAAYRIPQEKTQQIIDDVNNGRETTIACLPLDIAKTLSNVFVRLCKKEHFSAHINFKQEG